MTEHPTPPRQDEEPPVRRWPGPGWSASPVRWCSYGPHRWLCLLPTPGKPSDRATRFWKRLD